jgi:peptide/nickel transport system permease protein
MTTYIARRFSYMFVFLVLASIVSFLIIQLPPGDYVTFYVMQVESQGSHVSESEIASLRRRYGLDQPMYVQYLKWVRNVLRGDLGHSFFYNRPVADLIEERLGLTVVVSFGALLFTYALAILIGVYSAVRQYSIGDYIFTILGFAGVSIPDFLLALILIVFVYRNFGLSVGGLFSVEYRHAAWSWARFVDLLKHLPIPLIVIGTSGIAYLMRVMRATTLDEINKPYVVTARAKGLPEYKVLTKYPVRVALNPIISTLGWELPAIFSGATIVSIVLDLPTIGALLYRALMAEDMFLAASSVMITAALTIAGTLLSDILLVWLDPRIRMGR